MNINKLKVVDLTVTITTKNGKVFEIDMDDEIKQVVYSMFANTYPKDIPLKEIVNSYDTDLG